MQGDPQHSGCLRATGCCQRGRKNIGRNLPHWPKNRMPSFPLRHGHHTPGTPIRYAGKQRKEESH